MAIIGLKTIINYRPKQLTLPDNPETPNLEDLKSLEPENLKENQTILKTPETLVSDNFPILIQPRSETLISITILDHQEEETFLVPTQILDESIIFGNTISQARQQQILVAVINSTKFLVQITKQ